MTALTIIIQEPPYADNHKAWDALRLANAALTEEMQVRIFLLSRGVELGQKNQEPAGDKPHLGEMVAELMQGGAEVLACGKCLTECSLVDEDLMPGIARGSMKRLAGWIGTSTHALTF